MKEFLCIALLLLLVVPHTACSGIAAFKSGTTLGVALGDAEAKVSACPEQEGEECAPREVVADGGNLGTGWFTMLGKALDAAIGFFSRGAVTPAPAPAPTPSE